MSHGERAWLALDPVGGGVVMQCAAVAGEVRYEVVPQGAGSWARAWAAAWGQPGGGVGLAALEQHYYVQLFVI